MCDYSGTGFTGAQKDKHKMIPHTINLTNSNGIKVKRKNINLRHHYQMKLFSSSPNTHNSLVLLLILYTLVINLKEALDSRLLSQTLPALMMNHAVVEDECGSHLESYKPVLLASVGSPLNHKSMMVVSYGNQWKSGTKAQANNELIIRRTEQEFESPILSIGQDTRSCPIYTRMYMVLLQEIKKWLKLVKIVESVEAIRIVRLDTPQSIEAGQPLRLRCLFETKNDKLQSLSWYKNGKEFYRYQPFERRQPVLAFPLIGIHVDLQKSRNNTVLLTNTTSDTSGRFKCEATGSTFQEVNQETFINVLTASSSANNLQITEYILIAIITLPQITLLALNFFRILHLL